MPLRLDVLAPPLKKQLVDYCATRLNFLRYGSTVPFYLWEASNRREVVCVLTAAEEFLARIGDGEGCSTPAKSKITVPR